MFVMGFMTEDDMTDLYTMSVTANYEIGWDDTSTIENRQYPCLHSSVHSSIRAVCVAQVRAIDSQPCTVNPAPTGARH